MKLSQLIEARDDAWKREVRKEFNSILAKYGTHTKEVAKQFDPEILNVRREIFVNSADAGSFSIHRDKRAKGLLLSIAKFLHRQPQMGRSVFINYFDLQHTGLNANKSTSLDQIIQALNDQVRIDEIIDFNNRINVNPENVPIMFVVNFKIYNTEGSEHEDL